MKKFMLMGVAFSALFAIPATAADLAPRPAPVYRPPPPILTYNWTGCYIGGEIGGLWARKEWTDNAFNDRFFGQSFGAHNANGFLGGFQAGCDYQFGGGFVIGIQADYDWTSAKVSSANVLVDPRFTSIESRILSVGSATARIGYAWDRFLGYVKGGGAWEHGHYSFSLNGVTVADAGENPRYGWTIGIGGEYAFTNWLSGFIEYDYYNFGTRDVSFIAPVSHVDIRETNNVVKAGLNFRFGNWGGGVARY
jgi:outer membrane immunogenic protein